MSFAPMLTRAVASLLLLSAVNAFAAAGLVQFAAGDVKIRNTAGALRTAVKGGAVDEGDTILTAASASAQIKMTDGGILAVRPETELKVDTYRFAGKEDGTERAVMSLVKGGFRTITGLIGRTNKQNYTVNTPTAVIGIRGTDHEPHVIPASASGGGSAVPSGTYDKVNVGVAVIRSQGAEVSIAQNQVGFAAPGKPPVLLPVMPDIFRATPPVRQAQQSQKESDKQQSSTAASQGEEKQTASSGSSESTQTAGSSTSSGSGGSTNNTTTSNAASSTSAVGGISTSGITTATSPIINSAVAVVAPPPVVVPIKGTSDNGSTVDLTSQTVKTDTGDTVALQEASGAIGKTSSSTIVTTYAFSNPNPQFRNNVFETRNRFSTVFDDRGNLASVMDDDWLNDISRLFDKTRMLMLVGGGGDSTVIKAQSYDATGITMGWRAASSRLAVTGIDGDGAFSDRAVLPDGLSWIKGPSPYPFYLPGAIASGTSVNGNVISGTATYTFDGATTPRDQNGSAGTLNSASLSVNFNKQSVNLGLDLTTAAGRWLATASDVKMDDSGSFSAYSGSDTTTPSEVDTHRTLVVTRNGSSTGTFGTVQGQLMGNGISSAGLTYGLGDFGGPYRASGAVAFTGPVQDMNADYRMVGMVVGMGATGATAAEDNISIVGGFLSASRTQFSGVAPLRADAEYRLLTKPAGCTTCTVSTTSIPAVYAVTGATGVASIGSATVADVGSDAATGLSWGRYGGTPGATIGITDRISGANLGTLDVSKQSMHFITSGVQSGPVVLPVNGTASYTLIGNTNPTDNLGNVGTLGSATVKANFSAQTVTTAVQLSVAGSTWAAGAKNVPIVAGVFEAGKNSLGIGALDVTRNGSSSATSGKIIGAFSGSTGNGAALMYTLNQGGHSSAGGTTVSGVAAFKRP